MGHTSAHLLETGVLNYSETLTWNSPAALSPKYAIQTDPFWGQPEKKGVHREKEIRLAGALVPFVNNKIEFCFVGSQTRGEEPRKKASLPSNQSDKCQMFW